MLITRSASYNYCQPCTCFPYAKPQILLCDTKKVFDFPKFIPPNALLWYCGVGAEAFKLKPKGPPPVFSCPLRDMPFSRCPYVIRSTSVKTPIRNH